MKTVKKYVKKAGGPLTDAERMPNAQGVIPFEGFLRVCKASAYVYHSTIRPVNDKFLKDRINLFKPE